MFIVSAVASREMKMYLKRVRCWQLILKGNKLWISRQMLRTFAQTFICLDSRWGFKEMGCSCGTWILGGREVDLMMSNVLADGTHQNVSSHRQSSESILCFRFDPLDGKMCDVMMTIHRRVASDSFIALVLALFINTPSSRKCHFIIDFSTSDYSFFFSPRSQNKRAKEWSEGKSFEHYVTSISPTLVSITRLPSWSWLNFTYHPKTYRSITR